MPQHQQLEVEGTIADVFTHRFTIERGDGSRVLADLGPEGAKTFTLSPGLAIVAFGEMKPSELKVERIARKGAAPVEITHKPKHDAKHDAKHDGKHEPADPGVARRAVEVVGLHPIGEPRRKPKHFEVLARKGRGFVECHVELDGHIRKEKPVDAQDDKWLHELKTTA